MKTKPPLNHKLRPKDRAYILKQRGKKTQATLARELGVAPSTISDVLRGRTWKPAVTGEVTPQVTAK